MRRYSNVQTDGLGLDLTSVVGPVVDRVTAALLPRMKEIVASSAEAAEPTIRKVVVEDVLPKFGTAMVVSLVAGAAVAGAIGAWFATRRSGGVRRNPPRDLLCMTSRRRWAS